MVLLGELLSQKMKETMGVDPHIHEEGPRHGIVIDVQRLQGELAEQAQVVKQQNEETVIEDLFESYAPTEGVNVSTISYQHPAIGGVDVVVDIENLEPNIDEYLYKEFVRLITTMANVHDEKCAMEATRQLEQKSKGNEINVLYVLFRKVRLFDFTHNRSKELLINMVARLCAYDLKGRALLKGILMQSDVQEHVEIAIRSAGQIQAKEVIAEIFEYAKRDASRALFIPCMEAVVDMGDTEAVIAFLPLLETIPSENNKMIGQAITLSRTFHRFSDACIVPLFEALIQCNKRYIRPIYSEALKSFGERAIPTLEQYIGTMEESYPIRHAAKIIGKMRTPLASQTLRRLLKQHPNREAEILDGLAHTNNKENIKMIVDCLVTTNRSRVKQACLKAIASIGDERYIPTVRQYVKDPELYMDAIYCLVMLGDKEAETLYFTTLLNGTPKEQHDLEGLTSLFTRRQLMMIARKLLEVGDADAVVLLAALLKPNVLPKEIGPFLRKLLNRHPAAPVRLGVYRITGKFVGAKEELLPKSVLTDALRTEDAFVKREVEAIIRQIGKQHVQNSGAVSIKQG